MTSERQTVTLARALQMGTEHHRAGRLKEAETIYRQILEADPENPDALHLLGVMAHQAGNHESALELFDRTVRSRPEHPGFLASRGNALQGLRRYEEAIASYDRAVATKPDYAEAFNNRGHALSALARHEEALASYDRAVTIRPGYVEALVNRGHALSTLGRHGDALDSYDKFLALRPDHAGVLVDRGNALLLLGRYEEALASYDRALAIRPDFPAALSNRGNALQDLKRYEEALASYDRALAITPDYVEGLNNRGRVLKLLRRYGEALASYDRALAIRPDYVQALSNRGLALEALHRYDEALASYDRALAIDRDHAEAWSSRGNALKALGRYDEALASYARALAIQPDFASAHWNESLCRLLIGDFERGWKKHEWRWKWKYFSSAKRDFPRPLWLGEEDIAGKTILLHAEQGQGDTIQFCRYAKLVAQRGAVVLLEVQPQLKALLGRLEGVSRTFAFGESLPEFDFHCPLMSLPLAFCTRLDIIPCEIPYLFADPKKLAEWTSKLGSKRAPRIGLAWSGTESHENDPNRSLPLELLVGAIPSGFELYSLQKDVRPADAAVLQRRPDIIHFGENFVETAALAMHMDLVISVDTSIAHLAGALGLPVWLLLSASVDWRWLLDREDSPWYPTARLFRQGEAGDWVSVLERVSGELKHWLGSKPGTETA